MLRAAAVSANAGSIQVDAPRNGSELTTTYVALEGTAAGAMRLHVLDGEKPRAVLTTDPDGHFDTVLALSPGRHELRLTIPGDPRASSRVIQVSIGAALPALAAGYEKLREGDILLSRGPGSLEYAVYNPRYTHAGLYLGPDPGGTPMILEPVTDESSPSYGTIAAVPIDQSIVWDRSNTGLYRLKRAFQPGERNRLLAWARTVASDHASFWSVGQDFGVLYRTSLLWDFQKDRPRDAREFESQIETLRSRMNATDRFDCVTAIWRAYREGTRGRVDLSTPNRMTFGDAGQRFAPHFLARVRGVLIVPDTFALNGKLQLVAGN